MRLAPHARTAGVLAALIIGLALPFQPLAAGPKTDAPDVADDMLKAFESGTRGGLQFGKQPREVRIANCLREARNTADQMALNCERQPPDKKGNPRGLSDCYDQVVDWLRIEEASCRRMR